MCLPDTKVVRVNLVIRAAISGKEVPSLTSRLAPHDVISGIDHIVAIVIACQRQR